MKRQLIEDILVGCLRYKAMVASRPFSATSKHADSNGYIDYNKTELLIRPGQSATRERETVMHEVLHAIWDLAGLSDENIVNRISPLLLDTLRRNPHLVDFLLEKRDSHETG